MSKFTNELFKGMEFTNLIHYNDAHTLPNTFTYDDLPKNNVKGVLKANQYVDGKLTQVYSTQDNHVGIIAATRLGKTTSYVIPTILSFARQKAKKSMLISDPKGELYKITSKELIKQGYKVLLFNYRNYEHSECWNPLTKIFRLYKAIEKIDDEVKVVDTPDGERFEFRGIIYDNMPDLNDAVNSAHNMAMDDVGSKIDEIVAMVCTVENDNDPYWEVASGDVLRGFLWAMLEDSDPNHPNPITEDTYSFDTLFKIRANISSDKDHGFQDKGYFKKRKSSSRAYMLIKNCLISNAGTTAACILSIFNSKLQVFRDTALRALSKCNSFDNSILWGDEPVAIFINYRDELKIHYKMIALLIQDSYCSLIDYASNKESGQLDKPFYFILDEFGNFPKITDFDTTISACAGRNIYFILIIQSYAQLNNVYGDATASIIRDNLNMRVFLGSNNTQTLEEFSKECGSTTVLSPLSAINGEGEEIKNYQYDKVPVMPRSRLSHFEVGEAIITEANSGYVLLTKLERFYEISEMNALPRASLFEYTGQVNPFDMRYNYKVKIDSDDDDDDEFY